jgi:hypothetical protein
MALEAPTKLEQGVGPQSAVVIRSQAWDGLETIPEAHISAFERAGRGGLRNRSSSNKGKGDACRHCQGRGPINEAAEANDLRDSLQQA